MLKISLSKLWYFVCFPFSQFFGAIFLYVGPKNSEAWNLLRPPNFFYPIFPPKICFAIFLPEIFSGFFFFFFFTGLFDIIFDVPDGVLDIPDGVHDVPDDIIDDFADITLTFPEDLSLLPLVWSL